MRALPGISKINFSSTERVKLYPKYINIYIYIYIYIYIFKGIENRHDVYRGKDCMRKFCKSLTEHPMEIINLKKKKRKLLTNEQGKYICKYIYICEYKFEDKHAKVKKHQTFEICVLKFMNLTLLVFFLHQD